jgi:hypothetical protein
VADALDRIPLSEACHLLHRSDRTVRSWLARGDLVGAGPARHGSSIARPSTRCALDSVSRRPWAPLLAASNRSA